MSVCRARTCLYKQAMKKGLLQITGHVPCHLADNKSLRLAHKEQITCHEDQHWTDDIRSVRTPSVSEWTMLGHK